MNACMDVQITGITFLSHVTTRCWHLSKFFSINVNALVLMATEFTIETPHWCQKSPWMVKFRLKVALVCNCTKKKTLPRTIRDNLKSVLSFISVAGQILFLINSCFLLFPLPLSFLLLLIALKFSTYFTPQAHHRFFSFWLIIQRL